MLEQGGSHLIVPPVGCPCPIEGPILVASPNTPIITNQHICIQKSQVHIRVFHILYNHTMKLLQAFKSFLIWKSIAKNH